MALYCVTTSKTCVLAASVRLLKKSRASVRSSSSTRSRTNRARHRRKTRRRMTSSSEASEYASALKAARFANTRLADADDAEAARDVFARRARSFASRRATTFADGRRATARATRRRDGVMMMADLARAPPGRGPRRSSRGARTCPAGRGSPRVEEGGLVGGGVSGLARWRAWMSRRLGRERSHPARSVEEGARASPRGRARSPQHWPGGPWRSTPRRRRRRGSAPPRLARAALRALALGRQPIGLLVQALDAVAEQIAQVRVVRRERRGAVGRRHRAGTRGDERRGGDDAGRAPRRAPRAAEGAGRFGKGEVGALEGKQGKKTTRSTTRDEDARTRGGRRGRETPRARQGGNFAGGRAAAQLKDRRFDRSRRADSNFEKPTRAGWHQTDADLASPQGLGSYRQQPRSH